MNCQIVQDDLHIHGGVVEQVVCQGDVIMHGGCVNTMTVQGDCIQHGGIINRRVQQTGSNATYQQTESKVVYKDRVIYKDRVVYRDRPTSNDTGTAARNEKDVETIARLRSWVESLERDVDRLKGELDNERESHRQEVDELKWRLDAVTEIANGRNERLYEDETKGHYIGVTDESLDVLFSLINDYPISYDCDLSEEYGISVQTLKYIAKVLRLAKSPEERREARERLKRHGMDLIERRGGDQTKGKKKKTRRKTDGSSGNNKK